MQVALTEGGALYGAGASAYGHFADDSPLGPDSGRTWQAWGPLERFSGESIVAMACSEFHGVAVTEDRKVRIAPPALSSDVTVRITLRSP